MPGTVSTSREMTGTGCRTLLRGVVQEIVAALEALEEDRVTPASRVSFKVIYTNRHMLRHTTGR